MKEKKELCLWLNDVKNIFTVQLDDAELTYWEVCHFSAGVCVR